jgi:hypothetical protein
MRIFKSGISGSDDDALLVVRSMRLYLGKLFARWVNQNTNARNDSANRATANDMTMRCLLSVRGVCIFENYLQDGFTKIQTHAMT